MDPNQLPKGRGRGRGRGLFQYPVPGVSKSIFFSEILVDFFLDLRDIYFFYCIIQIPVIDFCSEKQALALISCLSHVNWKHFFLIAKYTQQRLSASYTHFPLCYLQRKQSPVHRKASDLVAVACSVYY